MADTKDNKVAQTNSNNDKSTSGDVGADIGDKGKPGNVTGDKASTAKSQGPGGDFDKGSTKE